MVSIPRVPLSIACFGLLLALVTPHGFAASDELVDKNRELNEVQERIKSVQHSLGSLETQKNSLAGQLGRIELKYGQLAKSLRDLESKVRVQSGQMGELKQRKQQLRNRVLKQNRALAGQIRAAYAAGRREWLKLLLNQEDPATFSRVLTYYGYLNRARFSQLQAIRGDLSRAQALGDELLAESERLNATRTELRNEQAGLEEARRQRKDVLNQLEREFKDKNTQLKQLLEDAHRLQGLIASLQQAVEDLPVAVPAGRRSFAALRGQLGWPVKGEVQESFGAPRMSGRWDGVLIRAQEGTAVRAVSQGRVAFSDWLRGYGLLTIIDHGDGYMSLYAFNQSLYKSVGEWVEAGDVIASVGASGGQAEPGLYFGIREKGRPINPLLWCARAQ